MQDAGNLADLRMNCWVREHKQWWTLAELASLCPNSRWRVSLSLSKCCEDTAALSQRCVCHVRVCTVARLSLLWCHFIRMERTREQNKVSFLSGLSDQTKWKNKDTLMEHRVTSSRKTPGKIHEPYNQLSFPDWKNKVSIVWWSDQESDPYWPQL